MNIRTPTQAPAPLLDDREGLPFETDRGIGTRANLGLIVLRTDQTIEDEFRYALPAAGVGFYETRLHNDVDITPANLGKMSGGIPAAVGLLPDIGFDVIGFGCTSGALVIGDEEISDRVRESMPGVKVTNPVAAARAAFSALGVERIALLTPYLPQINHAMRDFLMNEGMQVPVMGSFNEPNDNIVARISPASLERAILDLGRSKACDAVFVSCTSLRVARIVDKVEQELKKPVTSSNHALAWHMLRLAGISESRNGLGELFSRELSEPSE